MTENGNKASSSSQQPLSLLKPPTDLLNRLRWLMLLFTVLSSTPAVIALARSPHGPLVQAGGAALMTALLGSWALVFRRRRLTLFDDLFAFAALLGLALSCGGAASFQGFLFAVIIFTQFYPHPWRSILRTVLLQAAFFGGEMLTGHDIFEKSILSVVGFTMANLMIALLARAMEQQAKLEADLRAREARFRTLVTNASDMIFVLSASGGVDYQSPTVQRLLGHAPEAFAAQSLLPLVHPDDAPAFSAALARALATRGGTSAVEARLRHADASWRDCEALLSNLLHEPHVAGVVLNVRDVTDRKKAADALRTRELQLKQTQAEVELAARVQTALLPTDLTAPGFDISALMMPADEVGGDYYDVLPTAYGCFVGIGDVAGHGLNAGLIMLMIQSTVAALVRQNPSASPRDIIVLLNQVLYDNIRNRLGKHEHVTLSLLRLDRDGTVTFAGAHEDLLIYRGGSKRCEPIPTPGTWLGAMRDVAPVTIETTIRLSPGDTLVLHTDGVTEARSGTAEEFGVERLAAQIEASSGGSAQALVEAVRGQVLGWATKRVDDLTLVAVRYLGVSDSDARPLRSGPVALGKLGKA